MGFVSLLFGKKNERRNLASNDSRIKYNLPSEREFVREQKKKKIGIKSALMEFAALNRGFSVKRLSEKIILVNSRISFHNMNGEKSSRVGMYICDRKHDARFILKQNGLAVVDSKRFYDDGYDQAIRYAQYLGFPVVVKPTNLARGRGITTNIQDLNELRVAWQKAFEAYRKKRSTNSVLIEKHFKGEDYRFFVVGDKVISATHRKGANVIGDGNSTVLQLIKNKNNERLKNPYLENYLIPVDIRQLDLLLKNNINLNDIPKKGELVLLRSQSNLSAGGDSIDVTDSAHPDFHAIAIKAIQSIPGIEYGGVDIITPDITIKPTESNYIVSEVEFSPAPLAHFPFIGERRDMAGAILDYYIENTKN